MWLLLIGRWVVGMEDWNSKMEKRVHQISELVLLANSYVQYLIFQFIYSFIVLEHLGTEAKE